MKRRITLLVAMIALALAFSNPAAAENRYIVRTTGGLSSVLNLCLSAGCHVQGSLDGPVGQTYLVTSSGNLIANLLNGVVNLLEALLGIQSVEPDQLLPVPHPHINNIPPGLHDRTPVNYYGTVVWHGYASQPAAHIIRLIDAQQGFNVSGTGIVAVIDTGVDTNHPVLVPVLLPGYDFTRNQPGASEWLDVSELRNHTNESEGREQEPAFVQQSTAAVLDQSTAAVLDGGPYSAFGHGTMTTGLVHLVAPKAKILPLKAFSSNGTGQLSNIIAALYYAVHHKANVVNMSFDLSSPSAGLSQAISYANYGTTDAWIAAPGEYVISTYPGGTYASASGTSFSSPLVAGTASLLLNAKSSSLNQKQAASALSHAIQLTPDLNHGRLDVYQAISAWVNSSSTNSGSGTCLLFCN